MADIWSEVKRKFIHLAGLSIPVIYYFVDKKPGVIILGSVTAFYFLCELLRFINPEFNNFFWRLFSSLLRRHERKDVTGTGYFLIGALLSIILFSIILFKDEKTYAIVCLYFLILGDFFAALVGIKWGRTKIFPPKSLEGSLACFSVCLLAALAHKLNPIVAITGALTATIAELVPLGINDNLTIPIISGCAMWIVAYLLI